MNYEEKYQSFLNATNLSVQKEEEERKNFKDVLIPKTICSNEAPIDDISIYDLMVFKVSNGFLDQYSVSMIGINVIYLNDAKYDKTTGMVQINNTEKKFDLVEIWKSNGTVFYCYWRSQEYRNYLKDNYQLVVDDSCKNN